MRHTCILSFMSLFLLMGLTGCWNENTKNCWMGDVAIHVMAERFQELPGGKTEEVLSARISSIRYYLYQGDVLYQQGVVDDKEELNLQNIILTFSKLPFGDYSLSLLGNASEGESITYPGPTQTKDYFVSYYRFTVDCECGLTDFTTLYRSQGVTQFELKNLPDNITEIEVSLNQLNQVCQADTTYRGETELSYRMNVVDVTQEGLSSFVIGSFPTVAEGRSELILRLYADGNPEFLVYESKIGEAVIVRNQLVRVEADFNHSLMGDVVFDVTVNPEWDGVGGGDVPVE